MYGDSMLHNHPLGTDQPSLMTDNCTQMIGDLSQSAQQSVILYIGLHVWYARSHLKYFSEACSVCL